jgi:hypothetical protein
VRKNGFLNRDFKRLLFIKNVAQNKNKEIS